MKIDKPFYSLMPKYRPETKIYSLFVAQTMSNSATVGSAVETAAQGGVAVVSNYKVAGSAIANSITHTHHSVLLTAGKANRSDT